MSNDAPNPVGYRLIVWMLLLSLLLHAGLLTVPQIHLVLFPEEKVEGIEADLVNMLKVQISSPPAPVAEAAPPPPRSKAAAKGISAAPPPGPVQPSPQTQPVPEPDQASPAAEEAIDPPAADGDVARADGPAAPRAAGGGEGEGAAAAEAPPQSPPPPQPRQLTVHYTLLKGADGMKVGKVIHTWEIKDGRYVISSVMEATGFFALLKRGMFVQSSQGRIGPDGLVPEQYWEQRGQEPDRTFSAQFDHEKRQLTYGRSGETTTVALPPGTQDQLSFAYQFALKAPLSGTLQFHMTNGRKLGSYSYKVEGEMVIESKLGELRTLHLIKEKRQPGDDSVEVWLAADHHYLPVKVRITNSKGEVAEQVVEGIRQMGPEGDPSAPQKESTP